MYLAGQIFWWSNMAWGCPIVPGWIFHRSKKWVENWDFMETNWTLSFERMNPTQLSIGQLDLSTSLLCFATGIWKIQVQGCPSSRTRLSQFVMHVTKALHHPRNAPLRSSRWRASATFPPTSAICSTSTVTRQAQSPPIHLPRSWSVDGKVELWYPWYCAIKKTH